MLTIEQCREYLDAETNAALDDAAVVAIRDDLYALARLVLDDLKNKQKDEQ